MKTQAKTRGGKASRLPNVHGMEEAEARRRFNQALKRVVEKYDSLDDAGESADDLHVLSEVTARGFSYVLLRVHVPENLELTPRQMEIALLVGEGLTNAAIGRKLGITGNTVATHLRDAFKNLEVRSRTELALRVRVGLLCPEER